jgi:hypothetical protein
VKSAEDTDDWTMRRLDAEPRNSALFPGNAGQQKPGEKV